MTVVTEGIFCYCGVKVKIDTDRHLGPEAAVVRADGEPIGHVTTGEYGSQMLSLGGVHHLTGGSKTRGPRHLRHAARAVQPQAGGAHHRRRRHRDRRRPAARRSSTASTEQRMRVGCGSATIGMFATQWHGQVDEVVVVDDHITGVVSEHQAGKVLGWPRHRHQDHRPPLDARPLFPGVASPALGWGGTTISDPLRSSASWNAKKGARPGLRC